MPRRPMLCCAKLDHRGASANPFFVALSLSICRERLSGRIAKLETQLASAAERAEAAEQQLAAVQQEANEELRQLQQEAEAQLAEARHAAAVAREQTEQQSAR